MRLTIPLTGTVLVEDPIMGDDNDPIRPIDIDLGNVSWLLVSIDLENEVMEIEIEPASRISEPTGKNDAEGKPIYQARATTQTEKLSFLQHARDLVENHTKDELYVMAKCSKLKRPFKEQK